ncbi:MAG: protein kinase [Acidobacteria bacterium]|nr:protein kinase [Acidobacteriota bacterium]
MPLSPGSKLGPYEIISAIGSGGMGDVWKARDTRLGRIVAIKKVKEQHSERFKQEARSIAALNHPNICQLHDIGEDYLVLEYVEGKPLSSPLPEQEAVRLAIQITTALEEAHQHGIIHRDLKPSNIMVTDKGSVKLLDFGLAKLYEQDASISSLPTADFPATQAGAILGTVAYMSPEQAQGQPADVRSDIFSFGLVLYEVLSGERAFSCDSVSETIAALLRDEPAPLKTSPLLERIVKRCLEKNSSDRYQTMSQVKAALEKVVEEKKSKGSTEPQPSIAVLPFVNMSGDKEQEYFSDGLAEEIINALTQIQGLKVVARTSAFAFKGKEQDIRKIADILNVRTILEGSVRKSGNRIRITAQLINAMDGYHLWSERYDRDMTDVFVIQDEICQTIVDKLRVQLTADRPIIKQYTKNVDAHSLYLKGLYQLEKTTPESLYKCKEYFQQALEVDQNYSLAWYGLSWFYHNMGFLGYLVPGTAMTEAKQAVLKALGLDEMLPEARAMLARFRACEYDWEGAEHEFRRTLELAPNSVMARHDYATYVLMQTRRLDMAIDEIKKAVESDPLSSFLQTTLGTLYYFCRQWEPAVEYLQRALEFDPNFYTAYQFLGFTYLQVDKPDEGIAACEKAAKILGQGQWALAIPGVAYAKAGKIDEAHRFLKELQALAEKTYVSPSAFAWMYCSLGEIEKGIEWFEKAIDRHDWLIVTTYNFPIYDPLRSHPRYKALLRKMNLEP